MSLRNFWDQANKEASNFLSTGFYGGTSAIGVFGGSATSCTSSQTCPVGWKCVGGYCVKPDNLGGEGGSQSPGSCGTGGGGGGGSCPDGGPVGCTTSTGGCSPTPGGECCSEERCCRYSALGGVQCFCGPCPPPQTCSQFCSAYSAANGSSAGGCSSNSECDECSNCELYGTDATTGAQIFKCMPKSGGPCHCPGSSCGDCETCSESGTCEFTGSGCQECCTVPYQCNCGIELYQTCCQPATNGTQLYPDTCIGKCRAKMDEKCNELCPPPEPPVTEPCDCNCHDECGDCEFCNAEGKCEVDPACDICNIGETLCSDAETCCPANTTCTEEYLNIFNMGGGNTSAIRTAGPPQWSLVGGGSSTCTENICTQPGPGNGQPRPYMVISNRSDIGGSLCDGGRFDCVPFRDSVCWSDGVGSPTLISSEVESVQCCSTT